MMHHCSGVGKLRRGEATAQNWREDSNEQRGHHTSLPRGLYWPESWRKQALQYVYRCRRCTQSPAPAMYSRSQDFLRYVRDDLGSDVDVKLVDSGTSGNSNFLLLPHGCSGNVGRWCWSGGTLPAREQVTVRLQAGLLSLLRQQGDGSTAAGLYGSSARQQQRLWRQDFGSSSKPKNSQAGGNSNTTSALQFTMKTLHMTKLPAWALFPFTASKSPGCGVDR